MIPLRLEVRSTFLRVGAGLNDPVMGGICWQDDMGVELYQELSPSLLDQLGIEESTRTHDKTERNLSFC